MLTWLLLLCSQAYGEVRTLYTAALARGFIMIAYYDLRAACLAMHSLQGAQLGSSTLDIHFSAPRDGSPEQHEVLFFYFQKQSYPNGLPLMMFTYCHLPRLSTWTESAHSTQLLIGRQ